MNNNPTPHPWKLYPDGGEGKGIRVVLFSTLDRTPQAGNAKVFTLVLHKIGSQLFSAIVRFTLPTNLP